MAYALGLPSELTALLQDMVDWDYETRGWRSEMQANYNTHRAIAANGTCLVHGCEFDQDAPSQAYRRISQVRINARGFEESVAFFEWDEDDDGVIDVDSGKWYFYQRAAHNPTIQKDDPGKFRSSKSYKPWNKLKALG